jgi:hypothetical protein
MEHKWHEGQKIQKWIKGEKPPDRQKKIKVEARFCFAVGLF